MTFKEKAIREELVELCRKFNIRISGDYQCGDLRIDGVEDKDFGWLCSSVGPAGWEQ